MAATDPTPPQGYPTIPPAPPEVRDWFRRQILGAHYVVQGKGFEALTRDEQRKLVLRDCARILDSVVREMTDGCELERREETQGDVLYPGPNIPEHPCSARIRHGGRQGRDLGAPKGKPLAVVVPEVAPAGDFGCSNCGEPGAFWGPRAQCPNCKATFTWDADGYIQVEIEPTRERELFVAKHGLTPEAELDRVLEAGMDWTPAGLQRYYRALLLDNRPRPCGEIVSQPSDSANPSKA